MEIRLWQCYFAINCAIIIPFVLAKPFSLNKALAEARSQRNSETTPPQELTGLNEDLYLESQKYIQSPTKKNRFDKSQKKLTAKQYKELYITKKPYQPKRLITRNERFKKISALRKSRGHEKFEGKYPLLQQLSLLFDNLLSNNRREPLENEYYRIRRKKPLSKDKSGIECTCTKSDTKPSETRTLETTTSAAPFITAKVQDTETAASTQTTTKATDSLTPSHVRSLRSHKNIPVLLARNTFSSRRDNYAVSEGSGTSLHGSDEGDITRDHGNHERNTRVKEPDPYTTGSEEDTTSTARNFAGNNRHWRTPGVRIGGNRTRATTRSANIQRKANSVTESIATTEKYTTSNTRRSISEFKGENINETRRNETKSSKSVPEYIRNGAFVSEHKKSNITKSIQPQESNEKSVDVVTSHKRLSKGDGELTEKIQEVDPTDEAIKFYGQNYLSPELILQSDPNNGTTVVMIIDGYSIARDINGDNKLTERTIRIHS